MLKLKSIFIATMIISSTASASIFESTNKIIDVNKVSTPITVYVYGEISQSMAQGFAVDMAQAQQTGQDIIPIMISSYGGSVYALLEMIDIINLAKANGFKIATITVGKAMSAAAVLLTCGNEDLRFASANATIMIHDVATIIGGKIEEIKASAEEGDRLNNILFETMSLNIGKGKNYLSDIVHKKGHTDWFLNSKEALSHGIINKIKIPEFKVKIKTELLFE